MKKLLYNRGKQVLILFSSYTLTAISCITFYFLQNESQLTGGKVALAKAIWLGYTILVWFIIPTILILDARTPVIWKSIYQIFLSNMLLRAIIELLMIYTWLNWDTDYGIAHDVFSIVLLSTLALKNRAYIKDALFNTTLIIFILMFVVEIGFASYMASSIAGAGSSIYFVPDNDEHEKIIFITWIINLLITVYLYFFSRAWLHEK